MRPGRVRRAARWTAWVLVGLGVAACDEDRGPGTVRLQVSSDVPLGAVLVELTGSGIEGVETPPGAWVELSAVQGGSGGDVHRLLVILEAPGSMDVELRVADLDDPLPRVRVVQASGADDRLLPGTGGVRANVRR